MISLRLPEGWGAVDGPLEVTLVSRPALTEELERDEPRLRPGDVILTVSVIPRMAIAMMGIDPSSPESIAAGLHASLIRPVEPSSEADVRTVGAAGSQVAIVSFRRERSLDGAFLIAHSAPGVVTFAAALGRRNDIERRAAELAELVASVEFHGDVVGARASGEESR